ncbi:restriction endonuclease [Polyangium mundeleinium]|uniref:Restriction endonuclease n=1 Tax=Polyangium mundeleinium TaxID=2995306 RepID=A0ABT5EIH9_9BACT|nr:restriction endonuclease [Polyangium mundeleinium]MDC0741617.1 restriction endonuclease [Polyangium mundeleinium]
MWMIRAGRGSENIEDFVRHGIVALGDKLLGAVPPTIKKEALLELYAEKYPDEKEGSRASWAGQLLRFIGEIKLGDEVVTFDRERRKYLLGKVTSEYYWDDKLIEDLPAVRRVEWTHEVSRDLLSTKTRNTLGAIQTLFKLSADAEKDLRAHAVPFGASVPAPKPVPKQKLEAEQEEQAALLAETFERADEFIEDAINALDWRQMQELVAGLLRAMGYRTTVAEGGPDRGVDIFASPDGLGLQEPRIFVEVKHRGQVMGAKEIRAFLGGRKRGDKCLYVSTGGFSKDAHYEADRADVATTLISLPALRKLVVDHYESLDAETRALVPLRRLYWPVGKK